MVVVAQGLLRKNHALDFADDVVSTVELALVEVAPIRFEPGEFDRAKRFRGQRARGGFAMFPQLVVFAAGKPVLDARVAHDHRFARHRRVVHALEPTIDVHHMIRPAEQAGELVEQPAVHADKLDLGRLAESGQMNFLLCLQRRQPAPIVARRRNRGAEFGEGVREQLANDQRRGDLQRGRTAHAGADGNGAVDGRAETAEVHAAFAQLDEHTLRVIRPGRRGIMFQFADPECLPLRKGRRDEFHFAVGARRRGDGHVFVHGDGQDQPLVVIGVVAENFQPARRPDDMRRGVTKVFLEEIFDCGGVQGT